jgi:ferric iron reductase protein FhuF
MNREESQAPSPISAVYQALRARQPKWHVAIGEPHGPGWILGTALMTATEGPFEALLVRIGERLQTADRRTIAASFALRYGWSAGVAFAPYLLYACVPTIALDNVSFKFTDHGSFERAALHHAVGVMLPHDGVAPHPSVQWLSSPQALLAWLRTSLVHQAQPVVDALHVWSHFSVRGLWRLITSAWSSQCMQIFGEIGEQTQGLSWLRHFFAGNDVVSQMQPQLYPVTYQHVTHVYHRGASCCRYYRLRQGHYCASCPLISQEERIQRNQAWMKHLIESHVTSTRG